MYKLCAFDLDGTLVDTIGDLAASLNYALEKNGLPVHTVQEVSRLVGHSVSYMCYMAVPEEVREARWQQVYADCDTHYALHCCDHSRPYEGILRTVSRLKAAGVTLAVVTNKPHKHAMHVVNELFPRDTFSIILGMMKKFEKNRPQNHSTSCWTTLASRRRTRSTWAIRKWTSSLPKTPGCPASP